MTKLYFHIKLVDGSTKILNQETYNRIKKDGVLVFTHIKQWVIKEAA
tara:strand:- start:35 stop:175 length:141 start_codon:yes stop_codon:yes gene_type:complete